MIGLENDRSLGIFPLAGTFIRGLDTVVDRVSDQVGQGIVDGLDNGFVQFDILADNGQIHLFVQHLGQITNHPRELVEYITYGLHAGKHDRLLQLRGHQVYALAHGLRIANISGGDGLQKLVA